MGHGPTGPSTDIAQKQGGTADSLVHELQEVN